VGARRGEPIDGPILNDASDHVGLPAARPLGPEIGCGSLESNAIVPQRRGSNLTVTRRRESWSWDSQIQWEALQVKRYKLVDGEVDAMTSGTADHDTISRNLVAELRERLRGNLSRAHGANLKTKAGSNGPYPDALIDCGPRVGDALVARLLTVVFEVPSKPTAAIDQSLKCRDHEAVACIAAYVLVDQDKPRVLVHARDKDSGMGSASAMALAESRDAVIEMPVLALTIPLRADYAGIS
jgi:Uma2 family endonuclease